LIDPVGLVSNRAYLPVLPKSMTGLVKRIAAIVLALQLIHMTPLWADALLVNQSMWAPSIVEIFITPEGIEVDIEMGVDGVEPFKDLLPDSIYAALGYGQAPEGDRRANFFSRQLIFRDDAGTLLEGKLRHIGPSTRILRDPFNGTPLPIQDEAPEVIRASLHYSFSGDTLPQHLDIVSPPQSPIGFVTYHNGVAINDFRYLVTGNRLNLDWEDPWYSEFQKKKLRRQNYSPMSGFIYVEPFEVRKEIIARPKDLQRWVDLGLEGKNEITVDMQESLKQKVVEFLKRHHPVFIDGVESGGVFQSINFLERTLSSSQVIEPPQTLSVDSAILGIIFVYPRDTLPQKVTMEWDLWDKRITSVPTVAVDQEGPFTSILEPDWNRLEWINFLKKPFVPTLQNVPSPVVRSWFMSSAVQLVGISLTFGAFIWLVYAAKSSHRTLVPAVLFCALLLANISLLRLNKGYSMTPEQSEQIIGSLLHNIYRAFDYRTEGEIYDRLAQSVQGELLTDIYLETKHSLVLANQGGASAKVKNVSLESVVLYTEPSEETLRAEARWTVHGSVGHWGHIHQRANSYHAILSLRSDEQQWKLSEMSVLQQQRM
jgi:hypothetical protein